MAGRFTLPANGDPYQWDKLYQIGAAANGLLGWGRLWNLVSLDDDSNYLLTLRNLGTGGHLKVLRSTDAAALLTMTDSGLTVTDVTITGGLTVNGNLVAKGNASIGDAAGDAHVIKGTVNVQHAADFDSTLNVDGAVTFGTTLNVTGVATVGGLTTTGDVSARDLIASRDVSLTGTGPRVKADLSNATVANRLLIQSSTVNGDTRLALIPNGASVISQFAVLNSATTTAATGGVLAVTGTGVNVGCADFGGGYLTVNFVNGGSVRGTLTSGGVFAFAAASVGSATGAMAGTEELRVVGQTRLEGLVEVIGNDIRLEQTQSLRATDGAAWRNLASIDSGDILQYGESGATGAVVNADYVQLKSAGTVRFSVDTTGLGFYGTAPIAKPTIVGAKGGNVALANLLTALANLGLLIDLTT